MARSHQNHRFLLLFAGFLTLAALLRASGSEDSPAPTPIEGEDAAILSESEPPPPPASTETAVLLMRVGLDAPALAAAGVSAQDAAVVVGGVTQALAGDPQALTKADQTFAAARVAESQLKRKVRSGLASDGEVVAYQQAKGDFAAATAAREQLIDVLFESGVAGLPAAWQNTLRTLSKNRDWKLPLEYLTVDRSQEDWVVLRDALANQEWTAEEGVLADPACAAFLGTCKADTQVAQAAASLGSTVAAVQTAWNAAVSN